MTGIHDRLQQALGAAYRIERELGGGGMSHVFVAEEVALGRRVVVKLLPLARAYRRLGELYEAKGDTKRALQRYADIVERWTNADPVLQPAVKDVRERIARLQKQTG